MKAKLKRTGQLQPAGAGAEAENLSGFEWPDAAPFKESQ